MFVFWTSNNKLNRVANGKRIQFACSKCSAKAMFYECTIDEGLKLYAALDLWKKRKRVMQCGDCLAVYDYFDLFPTERADAEKVELERKQRELEAEQAKQKAIEQERLKQEEEKQKKRAIEKQRMEAQVEDELSQLKKKLGK